MKKVEFAVVHEREPSGWSLQVVVVHALAAVFWGFIGMVAGERSIALSAIFGLGSLVVLAGVVMHVRAPSAGRERARRVLLVGDSVPMALGAGVLVLVVQDAVRSGTFGALVIDAGAALALFVPAALAPWLVAFASNRH